MLRSVIYNNNSDTPSTANRTITFVVNDGTDASNTQTRTLSVTDTNDAPTLSSIEPSSVAFTEDSSAISVSNSITVNDVDSTINSATVQITTGFSPGEDVLNINTVAGVSSTYTNGVLAISGNASVADYQTMLRSVTYDNTSDMPSTTNRSITFTVNDGTDPSSAVSRTVTVTATNDAPDL